MLNQNLIYQVLLVALGGSVGATLRFLTSKLFLQLNNKILQLPYLSSVAFANIIGSFAIGLIAGIYANKEIFTENNNLYIFLVVGVLGGFTTFSSFSYEVLQILRYENALKAGLYGGLSVFLSIIFCFIGYELGK